MPREKEYDSEAAKQQAYRERKRLEEKDRGKPWAGLEGEVREQAIRVHFGYAPSETRTQAEREAVAERLRAKAPSSGPMPSFPARENDLLPSAAARKKLGR